MRAVWSWLVELAELDRNISPEEAAEAFTNAGLEVESIERIGSDLSGVVVAQVMGKRRHPSADRLTVVDVIDEPGGSITEVVCGATNVPEPGGLVLWAKPGTVLPGGVRMEKRAVRGVESAGMLCAEDELGIGDDHEGIVVLSQADARGSAPLLGDAAALERLGLRDVVIEVNVHANRPDALGHLGLARELVAIFGGRLKPLEHDLGSLTDERLDASALVTIELEDPQGCPRYTGRIIDGLRVGPSPRWLRQRLRAVGVRPLSNLVDITNYVMFELGQPLHAFDYETVRGASIRVRRARPGEKMVTLDDVERILEPVDLLICDGQGPVALAGVMGGANSEVSPSTTRVLLESANFDPGVVRHTARRLGLHSEASHRFERGVDPNVAELASARAAVLMAQVGGGKIARGVVDVYPRVVEPRMVPLRASRASLLTGVELSREDAGAILTRLGLDVQADPASADRLQVRCPTFRPDLTREVDLIEEVLRIYGVHRVPATLPTRAIPRSRPRDLRPRRARQALVAAGMCEAITYAFTSQARVDSLRLPPEDRRARPIPLFNPMTVDQAVMRTSLLPNLLAAIARNISFGLTDIALFEIGSIFLAREPGSLPDEPVRIAAVMSGRRADWLKEGALLDFYDIKGALERVLLALCGSDAERVRFVADRSVPYLHPGVAATVVLGDGTVAGVVGEVHPEVRRVFGLEATCLAFELALEAFPAQSIAQMRPVPRFPAITRDISFFVDEAVPASRIRDHLQAAEQPLIERIAVLEDYRDAGKVPAGKKGMLWSITYRSAEGTLTDAQVDEIHEAIVAKLLSELPAQRR